MLYKPELAARLLKLRQSEFPGIEEHSICCHHDPQLPAGTDVINVSAGAWHAELDAFIAAH